jgi:hypothetical protein
VIITKDCGEIVELFHAQNEIMKLDIKAVKVVKFHPETLSLNKEF